jgi:hypothetical protein
MAWLKEGVAAGDFKLENGWAFTTKAGVYGTSYLQRALVTAIGLGANRPQDAIYPTSTGPDLLKKYDGSKKYVMHFEKGQLPPVDGFWSLTMYDKDYFFVDNPLNRYTLSQRNKLKANPDGSVDLYIQAESPGKDKESNWLPASKDDFHPDDAAVLAEGKAAVDHRRQLEDPRGQGSRRRSLRVRAPGAALDDDQARRVRAFFMMDRRFTIHARMPAPPTPILKLTDIHKSYNVGHAGRNRGAARHHAGAARGGVRGAQGAVGLGQEHAAQHHRPARAADRGRIAGDCGPADPVAGRRGPDAAARRAPWASCSSSTTCCRPSPRWRT